MSAGSANKAIGFINGLRKLGHDAVIYWRSVQPEDLEGQSMRLRFRQILKRHLSRFLHDPNRLLENLNYLKEEIKILKREKPDILFLRNELYNFSGSLAAKWLGIPIVLEMDCPTAFEHRHRSGFDKIKLPLLPEWIERWNWCRSRAIIAISDILKAYLIQKGVPSEKITVIPNGADPNFFRPDVGRDNLRKKFSVEDKVVIGWIGSLYGWSGLENLLSMTKKILKMRQDVVFVFTGGGKNLEVMQEIFDQFDIGKRVILLGKVPYEDVPQYVGMMDIAIVPYPKLDFWYPSSMKLFEYMSAQKAIVASAVSQVSDVIVDGENGYLFDPENLDVFVQKVIDLVDHPDRRERMARCARQDLLEKYTWVKHAEKMAAIMLDVLDRDKTRIKRLPAGRQG